MAKQTKTTTKKVEKTVKPIEDNIKADVENVVSENLKEIVEKIEDIQPAEDIINTVMTETPEVAQVVIEHELEKIENIQKEVENKINEVINANPGVVKALQKSNSAFTNIWNGMLVE